MRRRRGAFTMIEMLGALIMLAIVALIAARLFKSSMRVVVDAPAAQNAIVGSEAMLRRLRADCWNGMQVSVPTGRRAVIRTSEGKSVTWEVGAESVSRSADEEASTWPMTEPVSFDVQGPSLIVNSNRVRVMLASELSILNARRTR